MTTSAISPVVDRLSKDEVESFHRDGVIGPYTLCPPDEMAEIRTQIEKTVITQEPKFITGVDGAERSSRHYRHLDRRVVYDLASHPSVIACLSSILGPDLVLWRSSLILKNPGTEEALEIPYHQDSAYFGLSPHLTISCWLAIDPAHKDNGCVTLIPGTHKQKLPTVDSDGTYFKSKADPACYDVTNVVEMVLAPGQFFIFDEGTLHGSATNSSTSRRMCLSSRYTVPFVRMENERERKLGVQLISGEDKVGINKVVPPPAC